MVLFPDFLQAIDGGGRIDRFIYRPENTKVADSGIEQIRQVVGIDSADGKVVIHDEECPGAVRDGTNGAGGFKYCGAGHVFHAQLEIAHSAIDCCLGTDLVARQGMGKNQIESEILFHDHTLSHRWRCRKTALLGCAFFRDPLRPFWN